KQKDAHDRSRAPSHHSPLRRPRARHAVRFTYTLVQPEVHRIERPKSEGPWHAGPEKDFKELGPSALPRRMEWQTSWSASRTFRRGDAKRSWVPSRNRSRPSAVHALSPPNWTHSPIDVSSLTSAAPTRCPTPPSPS